MSTATYQRFTPIINEKTLIKRLFSPTSCLLVSFFGGLGTAIFYLGANSINFRTLKKDLWIYVLAFILLVAYVLYFFPMGKTSLTPIQKFGTSFFSKIAAILLWSLHYYLHRFTYRNFEYTDGKYFFSFKIVIATFVLGTLSFMALVSARSYLLGVHL